MHQCTFADECPSGKPTPDPVVLDLSKGKNARYYRYKTNVHHFDRVKDRQDAVQECSDEESTTCPFGPSRNSALRTTAIEGLGNTLAIGQVLSGQPTYDDDGKQTNGSLTINERNRYEYAAYHPEGQIKEAADRVDFLHNTQRHPRQCTLHNNLCGDTSIVGARQEPTGTALTDAQADRRGRGFNALLFATK